MKNIDFGMLLKNARINSGISVGKVCKVLSENNLPISEKTIYKWERNELTPDLKFFSALANIYNVSMASFFDGDSSCQALDKWEQLFISTIRTNQIFKKIIHLLMTTGKENN